MPGDETMFTRGRAGPAGRASADGRAGPAGRTTAAMKKAMGQFFALPAAVVAGFLALTAVCYVADEGWANGASPAGFGWLGSLLGDGKGVASLLSTLTSSIITVTSITFSLLLIALQQGSSALTTKVADQFLMRRLNQFFFGYFVGLSIFTLLNCVTAGDEHRPVFGVSLVVLLTMAALCLIVVMIYSTIDQMQPTQIVRAIHRHVLDARGRQMASLDRTRRTPRPGWRTVATLRADHSGHVREVDVDALLAAAGGEKGGIEVELLAPVGCYVAHGDPVAVLRSADGRAPADASEGLRRAVFAALRLGEDRDVKVDPGYGLVQLATVGWTSISTSKSNPAPGLDVLQALRDILARWGERGTPAGDDRALVVMADAVPRAALDMLENFVLVSSESMQSQTLADAYDTVALLLPAAPDPWAERLADIVRRGLSSLGDHVLTAKLEAALDGVVAALARRGFGEVARLAAEAEAALAATVGTLQSRSTRAPARG